MKLQTTISLVMIATVLSAVATDSSAARKHHHSNNLKSSKGHRTRTTRNTRGNTHSRHGMGKQRDGRRHYGKGHARQHHGLASSSVLMSGKKLSRDLPAVPTKPTDGQNCFHCDTQTQKCGAVCKKPTGIKLKWIPGRVGPVGPQQGSPEGQYNQVCLLPRLLSVQSTL